MTNKRNDTGAGGADRDRALWRRYRRAAGLAAAGPCPEPGVLAAFASGSLAPEETSGIEAHLVLCARCAEILAFAAGEGVAGGGAGAGAGEPPLPPEALERARRLVPERGLPAATPATPRTVWRRMAPWIGAAAAVALACLAGWRAGQEAVLDRSEAMQRVAAEALFELEELPDA